MTRYGRKNYIYTVVDSHTKETVRVFRYKMDAWSLANDMNNWDTIEPRYGVKDMIIE
jgi:hypothetical protein